MRTLLYVCTPRAGLELHTCRHALTRSRFLRRAADFFMKLSAWADTADPGWLIVHDLSNVTLEATTSRLLGTSNAKEIVRRPPC